MVDSRGEYDKGAFDVVSRATANHGLHRGSFQCDAMIYAQDGSAKCTQGKSLKAEEIITMNWLAQNVVGYIPEIEEMNERAQELMQLQGIKTAGQAETENDK